MRDPVNIHPLVTVSYCSVMLLHAVVWQFKKYHMVMESWCLSYWLWSIHCTVSYYSKIFIYKRTHFCPTSGDDIFYYHSSSNICLGRLALLKGISLFVLHQTWTFSVSSSRRKLLSFSKAVDSLFSLWLIISSYTLSWVSFSKIVSNLLTTCPVCFVGSRFPLSLSQQVLMMLIQSLS